MIYNGGGIYTVYIGTEKVELNEETLIEISENFLGDTIKDLEYQNNELYEENSDYYDKIHDLQDEVYDLEVEITELQHKISKLEEIS